MLKGIISGECKPDTNTTFVGIGYSLSSGRTKGM
jgi:hypothetical protein